MGAVFALFAGFYFWVPKIVGKTYNEFLGKVHFWTLFVGVKRIIMSASLSPVDVIEREKEDNDSDIVTDEDLDFVLKSLPSPKVPDPKNKNNKQIMNKLSSIASEKTFLGLQDSRLDILSFIQNKAGIYMFFNLVNGNTYIGSSIRLDRRFRIHLYNTGTINLPLYNAFKKYGLNNFAFLLLQSCEPSLEICLGLEQWYLDQFKPNYNILKLAGSSQGFKHSPETIVKLQNKFQGKLHPRFGSKASEEQKLLTSQALKDYYNVNEHHARGKKGELSSQYGIGGTNIIMTNEQGTIMSFPSINSARTHFKVRFTTISKNIDKSIIINGTKWTITSNK